MADVLPGLLNPSRLVAYTEAGFWGHETIYRLAARRRGRRRARLRYATVIGE
jgi:hypothetical protein